MTFDTCITICGDGFRVGIEVCDDGSPNTEGCNADCSGQLSGYYCSHPYNSPSACSTSCGDMIFAGTEQCEDNNRFDNRGCKPDCSGAIDGYDCT